eukprot:g3878.t1
MKKRFKFSPEKVLQVADPPDLMISFEDINVDNALDILQYSQPEERNHVLTFMDYLGSYFLQLPAFTDLPLDCSRCLLSRNGLNAVAEEIGLLFSVRILYLSMAEVASVLVPSGLMEQNELLDLFKYLSSAKAGPPPISLAKYNSEARRPAKPPLSWRWTCGGCKGENVQARTLCSLCGGERDQAMLHPPLRLGRTGSQLDAKEGQAAFSALSEGWICGPCTLRNSIEDLHCIACMSPRPLLLSPAGPKAKDGVLEEIIAGVRSLSLPDGKRDPSQTTGLADGKRGPSQSTGQPAVSHHTYRRKRVAAQDGLLPDCLQCSLRHRHDTQLSVPVLPGLGFHCMAHVGKYGDPYHIAQPLVLLELPVQISRLLPAVRSALYFIPEPQEPAIANQDVTPSAQEGKMEVGGGQPREGRPEPQPCVQFLLIVHDLLLTEEGDSGKDGEESRRIVNIVPHPWVFQDLPFASDIEATRNIGIGLFECEGISYPSFVESEGAAEASGVAPIGRMATRSISLHDMSFSPDNCQILLVEAHQVYWFYSVLCFEDRRLVTFHVIPGNIASQTLLKGLAARAQYVESFLYGLQELTQQGLQRFPVEDSSRTGPSSSSSSSSSASSSSLSSSSSPSPSSSSPPSSGRPALAAEALWRSAAGLDMLAQQLARLLEDTLRADRQIP